jgi:hypothetical protein
MLACRLPLGAKGALNVKCAFCLGDGKLSKEHLISKPIRDLFGIDRSMMVASLDGRTGEISRPDELDKRTVRLPCENCNSGWMSQLEQDTAGTLRRWLAHPKVQLTADGMKHVSRWLVKTVHVFGFAELDARRFLQTPTETAAPDITTARALAAGSMPEHVYVGAARISGDADVLWGVGNPTVRPAGPDRIGCRAINVVAWNLSSLQLWVAVPMLPPDKLRLPLGVTRLHPTLRSGSLRKRSSDLSPSQVRATYSDATTSAFFRDLEHARELAAKEPPP